MFARDFIFTQIRDKSEPETIQRLLNTEVARNLLAGILYQTLENVK